MWFVFLVSEYSGLSSGLELLKLIVICVLVIGASYYVTKKIGSSQLGMRKDSNFKIIDAVNLGQNKYLQLIKIGTDKYIVVAVSKENVTFITELSKDEVKEYQTSGNADFGTIMKGVLKKKDISIGEQNNRQDTDK